MVAMSQANLLANKRRKFMLSAHISKEETTSNQSVNFHWAPFPVEMTGASAFVPSPSGLKLLVIRNPENESPTKFEIWSSSQLDKEFHIPQKVHGSVYLDGWYQTIPFSCFLPIGEVSKGYVCVYDAGLKGSLGTLMRLVLLMSQRNHLLPNLHLTILVITRKKLLRTRILEAGKVKEIGKMNGEKRMQEKSSLPCLLSMLTVERWSISKEFQDR